MSTGLSGVLFSAIQCVIRAVINKIDYRVAGVRYV